MIIIEYLGHLALYISYVERGSEILNIALVRKVYSLVKMPEWKPGELEFL